MAWYWRALRVRKLLCPSVRNFYLKCRITYLSLTYNHFMDASYMADVCMGPMFWFVDTFTHAIGKLLVAAVISLTASVIFIAYWIGIPYWWKKNHYACIFLVTLGHWLLVNICFHYYMACTTHPGFPPEGELITEAVSICKKCIAPKPPRTHHCSVCNRCILKMDHHCPWLNNCVGYRNHRYFFMYMAYMVVGVIYLIMAGWELVYNSIMLSEDGCDELELEGHSVKINKTGALIPVTGTVILDSSFLEEHELEPVNPYRRKALIYMALINLGVLFALGALSVWHSLLITRGETSIEANINKAETLRLKEQGKTYRNPYNFGPKNNWILFLGLVEGRVFWKHILFPSTHEPIGDGLLWSTIHDDEKAVEQEEIFKLCKMKIHDVNNVEEVILNK
ncbi:palmitoyltransferase ZDHHC16B [Sitophilus oryzae]|uniref:Palmitoyltransferase n=1 Tax=Sitophilus oryzae TaxID=7048 RepID=A0A6J2XZA7_SITOR|nr:palmitoyltransferase ZDHHC16B [Sitophilus oryzae]